jgi:hypothetical protein
MGVAIIGFAAYWDESGKLCTFEYVTPLLQGLFVWPKANSHTASAPRISKKTPFLKHTLRTLNNFSENGEDGFHRMVL